MKITPEQVIQQAAVNWFKNTYCLKFHNPRSIIFSVPNGISVPCSLSERIKALDLLNKTGQRKGAPDLIIIGMYGRCVFPECKNDTGTQSPEQEEIEKEIQALGGRYFIFRSLSEFQKNISENIDWLLGKI